MLRSATRGTSPWPVSCLRIRTADIASATAGTSTAFELSGSGEGQAAQHVGRRVEVTGTLKAATAGGPTADAPLSNDLELRELDVTSVRASATGTCAPAQP